MVERVKSMAGRNGKMGWRLLATLAIVGAALLAAGHDLGATTQDAAPSDRIQSQPASDCVSDDLLQKVRHYYDVNKDRSPGYGANWKRVLVAFGDVQDSQLTAMSAADARTRESRWFGWQPIRKALDCIEAKSVQPTPEAKQTQQPDATSEISVTAGPDVVEGDIMHFIVTATPAPTTPLDVEVTVTATGSFAVPATTYTATIPTSGSWKMKLSSYADSIDELDGTVTATIDPGSAYTVSATASTATLTVQDDDDPPLPQVGITSGHMSISEGDDVTLIISSNQAPTTALTVPLSIVATGDFGVASGTHTVTIPTSGSVMHTISTDDDFTDEADGTLSITVGAGTGYDVSLNGSFRFIQIADDDLATSAQPQIAQQVEPSISVSTSVPVNSNGRHLILEGLPFTVTVTATPAPTSDLTVKLQLSQGGYHIVSPNATTTPPLQNISTCGFNVDDDRFEYYVDVTIPANQTQTTLNFKSEASLMNAWDSYFRYEVMDGDGYTVSDTNNRVNVVVRDPGGGGVSAGRAPLSLIQNWRQAANANVLDWMSEARNWDRVRLAFGDPDPSIHTKWARTLAPVALMTAREAEDMQSVYPPMTRSGKYGLNLPRNSSRWLEWARAAESLRELEECDRISGVTKTTTGGPSEIYVIRDKPSTSEGSYARFIIIADPAITKKTAIYFTITSNNVSFDHVIMSRFRSNVSNFIGRLPGRTVFGTGIYLTKGSYGSVSMLTLDDRIANGTGTVTFTLNEGDGYTIRSGGESASMTVWEND